MHPSMMIRNAVGEAGTPVVLLHGLGADEEDLMGVSTAFAPPHPIYSLRAPGRYGDGYQWFEIDWESETLVADPSEIEMAARYVVGQLPLVPFVCLGFSQGGIIAQELLRTYPDRVAGLILLSTWPLPTAPQAHTPVPILIQHGELDPVVPVRAADLLADYWTGEDVVVMKYPMAHQISSSSLMDIGNWFSRRFGDTAAARSVR